MLVVIWTGLLCLLSVYTVAMLLLFLEEINSDRDKFLSAVCANIESELKKIGLGLINVNLMDITDGSRYIE